jgi:hypothetical protein
VPQIGLLGLAHQEERHSEHCKRPQVRGLVAEVDDAGDEAVDEVMRNEPREALLEGPPPSFVSLHGRREADEAHVDREVGEPGADPRHDGEDAAHVAVNVERVQRERAHSCKRGEREGTHVEEDVVQ